MHGRKEGRTDTLNRPLALTPWAHASQSMCQIGTMHVQCGELKLFFLAQKTMHQHLQGGSAAGPHACATHVRGDSRAHVVVGGSREAYDGGGRGKNGEELERHGECGSTRGGRVWLFSDCVSHVDTFPILVSVSRAWHKRVSVCLFLVSP
jgi:hypothetical protein